MRNRLPIYLENRELPKEFNNKVERKNSYGYVDFMYLLSLVITVLSVSVVLFLGNR